MSYLLYDVVLFNSFPLEAKIVLCFSLFKFEDKYNRKRLKLYGYHTDCMYK